MSSLRVVFMGTPEFAVPALRAIAKKHTVVGVYTQPDRPVGRGQQTAASPVKQLAQSLGVDCFQPERLSQPGEWERLRDLQPDVICVVAYGQILKQDVLSLPRLGCVNVHSSLLPRWRGAAPIQWAILAGDLETGVTTQKMVLKLDAGEVLLQEATPITRHETAQSLHDRLSQMGAALLERTLDGLVACSIVPRAQDESQVTYAAKLSKEMEELDPKLSAQELERRVRALQPWPGTSIRVAGQRLKVKEAFAWPALASPEGQLLERNGMICLGTRHGCLELKRLQWEGKAEVDAAGFMNGLRGKGTLLPIQVGAAQ